MQIWAAQLKDHTITVESGNHTYTVKLKPEQVEYPLSTLLDFLQAHEVEITTGIIMDIAHSQISWHEIQDYTETGVTIQKPTFQIKTPTTQITPTLLHTDHSTVVHVTELYGCEV